MKRNLPFVLALLFSIASSTSIKAAKIDTVETFSESMHKNIKAIVITPDNYRQAVALPVVYFLHGFGGNHLDWINSFPQVIASCDLYHQIVVCANGNESSWYFDSPVDPAWKYETYVSKELIQFIDKNYKTIKDRKGRAITGLSMGGHGALYLAFKHQDVFGAAGSMSGGVDIRPFPQNWDIAKRLGKYAEHPENWEKNTVINLVYLLTPNSLSIIFDCGMDDFFFKVNENLHEKLVERNIPHDFIVRAGNHATPYWTNAINYQLLYMSLFFKKNNP